MKEKNGQRKKLRFLIFFSPPFLSPLNFHYWQDLWAGKTLYHLLPTALSVIQVVPPRTPRYHEENQSRYTVRRKDRLGHFRDHALKHCKNWSATKKRMVNKRQIKEIYQTAKLFSSLDFHFGNNSLSFSSNSENGIEARVVG